MNEEPKTILCVEDDNLELQTRRKLFEAAGFHVLQARSRTSAIEVFQANTVDAVVLDYWLSGSGGNGTAVAEDIKRISPTTPILMLSGYGSLPGEVAIVDAWMSKSRVEPQELVAEVKRLIGQRGQKTNLK